MLGRATLQWQRNCVRALYLVAVALPAAAVVAGLFITTQISILTLARNFLPGVSIFFIIISFLCRFSLEIYSVARDLEQKLIETDSLRALERGEPYCLYLRSFQFDQAFFLKRNWLRGLLARVGERDFQGYDSMEEIIRRQLADRLAVIAIGKSSEKDGMAAIETSDTEWHATFLRLAKNAAVIIIVPLATPGILFELNWLFTNATERTVFVLPPFAAFARGEKFRNSIKDQFRHRRKVESQGLSRFVEANIDVHAQMVVAERERYLVPVYQEPSVDWVSGEWASLRARLGPSADFPRYKQEGLIFTMQSKAKLSSIEQSVGFSLDNLRQLVGQKLANSGR